MRYIILSLLLLLSGCYYYPYYPYRVGYAYPRAYAPAAAYGQGPGPGYVAPPGYGQGPGPGYAAPAGYGQGQPPPYPRQRPQYYGGQSPTAYAPSTGLDPRNCGTPDEPKACGR